MNDEQVRKRLLGYLLWAGASSIKLSKKQEMKLKEWIIPYVCDELGLSTEPLKMEYIRKFIDSWESSDLNPDDYKHYYVDKNSNGKSLWDLV